jgi:hypothetical protein
LEKGSGFFFIARLFRWAGSQTLLTHSKFSVGD